MNKIFSLNALLICIFLFGCSDKNTEQKEIKNELNKIKKDKRPKPFDLSETIRVIHALEIAQKDSKNFDEYIKLLADQDYTLVAEDVVNAKLKLIPILKKLKKSENELVKAGELWKTFSKIGGIIVTEGSKISAKAAASGGVFTPSMALDIISSGVKTIDVLEKQKEVENEIKEKIALIKDDYIEYLEGYSKIYIKYMNKWDKVCLLRDNAYLLIHDHNLKSALISLNQVLEISPKDKEARLLKAMCLTFMQDDSLNLEFSNKDRAKVILEDYINDFPSETAPALTLLGSYYMLKNNNEQAEIYFNQSSIEYPKQASLLLDMLDSYKQRSYLKKTAEGDYILELYKSMMEGFGLFSPNFHKALIAHNEGNYEDSKEEILRHFFRRSNQDVYDYLISDMNHCSNYLSESFNLIFIEKSFLDLEATTSYFSSNTLNISLKNRSDIELENVRIFLCIHLTDMYKDHYEVIKLPTTINKIKPHSSADFGEVDFDITLNGKIKNAKDDIVHVRSIVLTDDLITWIDNEEFKLKVMRNNQNYFSDLQLDSNYISKIYESLNLTTDELLQKINKEIKFNVVDSYFGDNVLKVKLPRLLTYLNPIFSINELASEEVVLPSSSELKGKNINLDFDLDTEENKNIRLIINTALGEIPLDLNLD